ncbi:MAG: HEPN domain-containing protein [Chitinophagaceae bacterium]|nr:MAG: HEPN domain-containing protein [Chitinophagaceae bacterium]
MEIFIESNALISTFSGDLKEAGETIIKLIVPEKIFLAGIYENEPDGRMLYDLLIIITNDANRPYSEYKAIMEHISIRIWPVRSTILKMYDFFKKITAGHIYLSRICRPENLLYDNGCHPLPKQGDIPVQDIVIKAAGDFNDGWRRAGSFLEGARHYAERQEKELAVFMLHQAAELTFRALLKSLMDHELFSHDLRSLSRECRHCAPRIATIFPCHHEEDKRLLHLLQKAYVCTRYKDNYEISEQDLTVLLERVTNLHFGAPDIFSVKLKEAEEALNQLVLCQK